MARHSFAASEALYDHLEALAKERGVSVSRVIRDALYEKYDPKGEFREEADAPTFEEMILGVIAGTMVLVVMFAAYTTLVLLHG